MAKKNVNMNLVVVLFVLVGLLGYALLAQAGTLEPSAAPTPTMKTLQEVYDAASGGINEREGFCQRFETPPGSNQVVLTVPVGKRFVLLKLYLPSSSSLHNSWDLTLDDNLLFDGQTFAISGDQSGSAGGTIKNFIHDFPDRCVVVNAGQTLKVVNTANFIIETIIIGYFCDIP